MNGRLPLYLTFALLLSCVAPCPVMAEGKLEIVSPVAGATVAPGDLVNLVVRVTSATDFSAIILASELVATPDIPGAVGPALPSADEVTFALKIPAQARRGPMGFQAVAHSLSTGQIVASSELYTLDIEDNADNVLATLQVAPKSVAFYYLGESASVSVFGELPDQKQITLNDSNVLQWEVEDPTVVDVIGKFELRAKKAGSTQVNFTYGTYTDYVLVSVTTSGVVGDLDGDGDVDSNDFKRAKTWEGWPINSTNDGRDLNGDGQITDADIQQLVGLCTRDRCSTSSDLTQGILPDVPSTPTATPTATPKPTLVPTPLPTPSAAQIAQELLAEIKNLVANARRTVPPKPTKSMSKSKKRKILRVRQEILGARKDLKARTNQLVGMQKTAGVEIQATLIHFTAKEILLLKKNITTGCATNVNESARKKAWKLAAKALARVAG